MVNPVFISAWLENCTNREAVRDTAKETGKESTVFWEHYMPWKGVNFIPTGNGKSLKGYKKSSSINKYTLRAPSEIMHSTNYGKLRLETGGEETL